VTVKTLVPGEATPAEIARTVLDNIAADPGGFSMDYWISSKSDDPYFRTLPVHPGDIPSACGTTLCAAGWIVHSLGYVINCFGEAFHPDDPDNRRYVEQIAHEALELTKEEGQLIWFNGREQALALLELIAAGGKPGR
jgi:hypothetical protein